MESPQNLKKRLKSVHNINQITKAMELVSATKMRKSQQIAIDSRPYAFAALDFLATVSNLENKLQTMLQKKTATVAASQAKAQSAPAKGAQPVTAGHWFL